MKMKVLAEDVREGDLVQEDINPALKAWFEVKSTSRAHGGTYVEFEYGDGEPAKYQQHEAVEIIRPLEADVRILQAHQGSFPGTFDEQIEIGGRMQQIVETAVADVTLITD